MLYNVMILFSVKYRQFKEKQNKKVHGPQI